ncbi:hypothetical protein [Thalassospira indica]|uniref:Uncharacterized protein n=1 Tax=Thalassospira indica TaxID=1891279 RepID=A0ABM6Y3H1_9PROT|nr:hypothetical protein [Thalassospira indica]AXO16492.1 hypothetical protein DY252_21335 [Thalassospira indica]OAZ10667.1 hypothetical protein TH15_18960 [Thalassospira profundimaris]
MSIIDLRECDLPTTVWNWLIADKKEEVISDFLAKETLDWLIQNGAPDSESLRKIVDDYAMVAARRLISENDVVEAVRLGLSAFLETPFEQFVEDDEELIIKITTSFCNWFNMETGGNVSAGISYA